MSGDGNSWVKRYEGMDSLRRRMKQQVSRVEADWLGIQGYPNSAGETIINISDNSVGVPAGLKITCMPRGCSK